MNFLEQLVAEWYQYQSYYVRTSVKVGRLAHGGYEGELDVVAYKPDTNEVVHVETSMDADPWDKRKERFQRKFATGDKYIPGLFNRQQMDISRHAILGYPRSTKLAEPLGPNIQVILMPEFIGEMMVELKQLPVESAAVPETFPLIRAMQFAAHYGNLV